MSSRAREAQTTAIYRGEMFTGVWPWAELWRYNRDVDKWTSMGRAFTHPELTDMQTHPYAQHTDRFKIVSNHWGQRITGMIPIGETMFLSTSTKGTYEWYDKYDFLTDKQRREYGAVLKLTMPGNLVASITWTGRPLVLEFVVEQDRMVIRQDRRRSEVRGWPAVVAVIFRRLPATEARVSLDRSAVVSSSGIPGSMASDSEPAIRSRTLLVAGNVIASLIENSIPGGTASGPRGGGLLLSHGLTIDDFCSMMR